MAPILEAGSTAPLFITDFAGAMFFDEPQEGGGIFAVGKEDQTNILLFGDTNDVAAGGDEVDVIMGGGGNDNIMGAEGTDFMFGGFGDDVVRGGEGDDVVVGNQGSDLLIGGAGSDVFEFFTDQFVDVDFDVLLDFEKGEDSILIVGSNDAAYEATTGILSVNGSEVAILAAGLDLEITPAASTVVLS
ncbi:MAG: calcium-binding protein [Rivularia sp. (in: Bacteria)]|nr:calcium-binding protein [Rivularia sp. MS3]